MIDSAKKTGAIVTAEEHNVLGGLGGAVAEVICETVPVPVLRVGVEDVFGKSGPRGGTAAHLRFGRRAHRRKSQTGSCDETGVIKSYNTIQKQPEGISFRLFLFVFTG